MSSPPSIVVTVPSREISEVRDDIALAATSGADIAEVRIDRLSAGALPDLRDLFPSPLPLLATLRSRAEGGEGPDAPEERRSTLASALSLPFQFIDLEWERDRSWWEASPVTTSAAVVASRHWTGSPVDVDWELAVERLAGAPGWTKFVFPASVSRVLDEVVPRLMERARTGATVLTTGPSGPILRALGRRLEFPLVFAALPEGTGKEPVEPAQIPVDRLAPFLRADGEPPWFAVVGHPVAHSCSPMLHHEWMREQARVGLYVALDFAEEEEFVDCLEPLASWGLRGLNVTQPFKVAAFEAATRTEKSAEVCGAANCLTLDGAEVTAENTDLAAILRRLDELARTAPEELGEMAVVGAGGAARATLAAARLLGIPATVYARRPDEARALAREFGATAGAVHAAEPVPLVIHATNAGRAPEATLDLPLERLLRVGTHVIDWVYQPDHPTIRAIAEGRRASYEDGRRLLVYQAAAAYSIWWGAEPGESSIQRAVESL